MFLDRSRTKQLTIGQRLQGAANTISAIFTPLSTTLSLITTPIALFMGYPFVQFRSEAEMLMLLRLNCLTVLTYWLNTLHLSILVGYQLSLGAAASTLWMAPCQYHHN